MKRRTFIGASLAAPLIAQLSTPAFAQERSYTPVPKGWRTFEVSTRVEIPNAGGVTQAWVPIPGVDTQWQRSLESTWSGTAQHAAIVTDPAYGATMVHAVWDKVDATPVLEVVSRFETQDRLQDWSASAAPATPHEVASFLKATALMPTDGIVRTTSQQITEGRTSEIEKVRAIYEWVVANTYREPATRGCGVGDIGAMLETGSMGGKCADLNALFVGLVRAAGIPARDLYGIRVAKSAFGYRELGAGSPDISKAQHCRAEVWLARYGWVAMDPADVGKVMRQETPNWLKDTRDPVVAPVKQALFGSWEGNWLAYNVAHDVALPGSQLGKIGFLMYPQAETREQRADSLEPETFKYRITAREVATKA
ncbi:MAG: transglutaminase domain-containing protein [Casimicrobiaceae bacterium]